MTGTTRFLLIPALSVLHALPARGSESGVRAVIQEKHRQLLEEHCQSCHGAEKQKGKFRVDDLSYGIHDVQTAARWQKVLDAMNAGEMPPEDEKQPDAKAKTDFLEDLANTMVAARRTLADQHGEIALRRLNQREYQNTLRALLGVEIDVSELPSDVSAAAFDTVGSGLFMSGNQFEQYEAIGRVALEEAALQQLARGAAKKHRFEVEETLEKVRAFHQENLDAVDRGQRWVKAVNAAVALPENAKTVADLRKTALNSRGLLRSWEKIPGAPAPEEFGFKTKSNNADNALFWSGNVGFLKFDSYYLSQPHLDTGAYLTRPFSNLGRHSNNALFLPGIPADWPPGDYAIRVRIGATPREALRDTLAVLLTSPRFLYRTEPEPQEAHRPLTPLELASRLSYFLWGAPPDPALRAVAGSGQLANPEVLHSETERLLADRRSEEFLDGFLSQWLSLERLDFFQFNPKRFPRFDANTKAAARAEVLETFGHLLRENAPVTDLLKSNYVIVNGLLAFYYGLEGVQGDTFRKVALPPNSPRGGLLGMAAILAMGSNGERSNPVERGAWVLRKLLNDPPPPAPANVPEINRLATRVLTTRERLQAHQESPQCASCHRKIDPIGFGLENFDAAGQWRTEDSYTALDAAGKPDPKAQKTWAIEPAAALHKGPAFSNYHEMRDLIAARKEAFARGLTAALLEYALGRPCGFSDEPLRESIVAHASQRGFAAREFLHALIQSQAFQTK